MSINIDKEDLREAMDFLNLVKSLPLWYQAGATSTITYDGEYLSVNNSVAEYSAIGTGHGFPALHATHSDFVFGVKATIKAVTTDTECFFLFLEPKKGEYGEFQGFKNDGAGTHKMEFRSGGTEEEDLIAGQDWTTDTLFTIGHQNGVFDHNSGITGAIATGTAVSHGLLKNGAGLTPTSVVIAPTQDQGNFWVDTVGAATFNVNYDAGANGAFYWIAEYEATAVCNGYIGGVLKATCNDAADISQQPFCAYCAEPNGVARVMTLLYPPGIHMG